MKEKGLESPYPLPPTPAGISRLPQQHAAGKRPATARSPAPMTMTNFAHVAGHQISAIIAMAIAKPNLQPQNFMSPSSLVEG